MPSRGFSAINSGFGTEPKQLEAPSPRLVVMFGNGIEFAQMMDIAKGLLILLIVPIS